MGELVPASQVAEAIDIGPRAVRLKAVKNNWATVRKPKQGGSEMYFIRDLLPLEVQQNLVDRQAVVGNPEAHAYETPVPPRAKRIGLAKYNLVHAFRIAKAKAPWGEKTQAMDNFLLAYNTGLLLPQIFETVGSLSVKTLESLNRKLKEAQDDYLVLCDGRGGWKKHGTNHYRGRQLSEAAKAVFLRCYLTPNTPSVTMAVRATKMILKEQDIPAPVTESTYRRWLKDYAKHNAHVICLARKGMKAYVDQYGPYGTRDDSLLEVGQCLVADGKTLNFFIRHPVTGRPCRMKLIVFMDWKSRYPVGWQIMPEEDSIAILAAFRNAVATLGKYPESVYLDNGKAFKAKVFTETDPDLGDLVGLYARVGTATLFADPYSGRSKAVVERWFRTVQMQMEVLIPSYCGDSISTKPAWMHRNEKFHKAWHDAKTRGWIPNIREAAFLLEHYFNWYAQQPQKTLGTTPETLFLQGKGPGVDPLQLNHDFTWRTQAQPRNCRIRLWNIEYEGDCLHGLSRKEKIQIRYNTADMRVIWCYTQEGIYIGEVYPVEALHPLARLFGDEVSMAQVKDHNKRLARHKKHTVRHLKALGVGRDAVDSLGVLPFAAKVPVIPEGTPERPKPLPKAEELSTQDIKQLEAKVQAAEKEMQQKQDIPRPQYWASDLEHYEWCFSVIYQHGQSLNQEDEQFMDEFEALPEFEHYRQRFEDLKTLYE